MSKLINGKALLHCRNLPWEVGTFAGTWHVHVKGSKIKLLVIFGGGAKQRHCNEGRTLFRAQEPFPLGCRG